MTTTRHLINAQFALSDKDFKKFCKWAGVETTARQASKYRNLKGLAYKAKRGLLFRLFK